MDRSGRSDQPCSGGSQTKLIGNQVRSRTTSSTESKGMLCIRGGEGRRTGGSRHGPTGTDEGAGFGAYSEQF